MNVDCALLCDAATVREGMLHILGGGVTRIARQGFPTQLGVALALRIVIHTTETGSQHAARVVLQSEDGAEVGRIEFGFNIDAASTAALVPGEMISLPVALPTNQLVLPHAGGYSLEILIDGNHQVSVPFQIIDALALPPGGMIPPLAG